MPLIYANTPGLVYQPPSALAAGQPITSVPLSIIQTNADFANVKVEVGYAVLQDGDPLPAMMSQVDGYQFQASEMVIHFERLSTVSDVGGSPSASGGILEIADWVDAGSNAAISTAYMVQGGTTGDTHDGTMAVWIFGIRGRGLITIPSGLVFTYQADSVFAEGNALTQSIMQALSASAQQAALRLEVFTDAGQGTNWTPDWTPAVNAYGKPSWGRANGCYYQALEVVAPTAAVEPDDWPTALGAILQDGGVLWMCAGRGFSNGQQFNMPTSPEDGHVYTSGEMVACLTGWISTGQASLTGPSGQGRIQRLQKSAPGGAVSTTITYWDGVNLAATHDGVVHCVAIFQRALPAYSAVPPDFNIFTGQEFMSGSPICPLEISQAWNDAQRLNQNVNNAAVRPEAFASAGITNGGAPALPTSHGGYAYLRAECTNVWDLADTGAMAGDYALRLWLMNVDQGSGVVSCRIDYNQGGSQITTQNGSLNVTIVAARASNVVSAGISIVNSQGTPVPVAPGQNAMPNGSFETWVGLQVINRQTIGTPALWAYSNNTTDGYITQQPGLDSAWAVGLDVGNAHGLANTQYVSIISSPIPIVPGNPYLFSILAVASAFNQGSLSWLSILGGLAGLIGSFLSTGSRTNITQGFLVRLHLRDNNFANDVAFDLVPDQALADSVTQYQFGFTMPGAGDTVVQTINGPIALNSGAAVPANVTYLYVELWNYKPNITSTVICDDCRLIDTSTALQTAGLPNNTPAAAVLGYQAGGSLPAATYYVQYNYMLTVPSQPAGARTMQGILSAEASLAVPASNVLVVAAPAQALNGAPWNVHVGTASGAEITQATNIAAASHWIEPTTGLVNGVPPTDTVGDGRRLSSINATNQAQHESLAPDSINLRGYSTFASVALSTTMATLASVTLPDLQLGDLLYVAFEFDSISSNFSNNFFVEVEILIDGVGAKSFVCFIDYLYGADCRAFVFPVTVTPSSGLMTLEAALGNGTAGSASGSFYVGNQEDL
jgi:hypothetical protein